MRAVSDELADRWALALTGAAAGLALWAVAEAEGRGLLSGKPGLVVLVLVLVGFGATLVMAGPIGLGRAGPRGFGLGLGVAGLVGLYLARHDGTEGFLDGGMAPLATLAVAALPVPFLIAQARGDWRAYGALFPEAWSIVVRSAAAWVFVGVVWLVVILSDQVLQIVGIGILQDLMQRWIVPSVLTGAILGLGLAVVHELADYLSPYLVLRLFRLLLPAVLAVVLLFLAALPFRGLNGLVQGLSPALLLLTMTAAGIALIAAAIDQDDARATESALILRAARVMALALPLIAGLAAWALWQRVAQYGWTPERLFLALIAGIGLAYGLAYAQAVLRGAGWMARIRRGNVALALGVAGLAALWLTPLLNAERLTAQSQLDRYLTGRTALADLDLAAFDSWGRPGAEALATLTARAAEPGQEALAARLAAHLGGDSTVPEVWERTALAAALQGSLPVQPATAAATRDRMLGAAPNYLLQDWEGVCALRLPDDAAPCLIIVADLLPALPGDEAILMLQRSPGYVELLGLFLQPDGQLATRTVTRMDGAYVGPGELVDAMAAWATAPPPVAPAPVNQLGPGPGGLVMVP
jgi:hypothetical protein